GLGVAAGFRPDEIRDTPTPRSSRPLAPGGLPVLAEPARGDCPCPACPSGHRPRHRVRRERVRPAPPGSTSTREQGAAGVR
ncbi:hypothetical protein NGM37_45960, partial [Streptomyces sp. TRM76130]|nr:hypothetical protein [Streptomyces sp. TRM76130]